MLDDERELLALCPSGGSPVQPIKTSVVWGHDAGELVSTSECRGCPFKGSCVAEVYGKVDLGTLASGGLVYNLVEVNRAYEK